MLDMGGKKRPQTYYPAKYGKYKEALALMIQAKGIPKEDYGEIRAIFYLPYPKRTPKYKRVEGSPHRVKPDTDNFAKGLLDALEIAGVLKNDSQIYATFFSKFYTIGVPRIEFKLL
ncbi:MAG: RusA family crossover junction endodeoxyribonuclease [Candidatus Aenigmatarchaeota archaeon]|nr:MAG: RusA family crossover junction endodeoxyribonuclease [Candidatus Aenigmarchaeota archaeon]